MATFLELLLTALVYLHDWFIVTERITLTAPRVRCINMMLRAATCLHALASSSDPSASAYQVMWAAFFFWWGGGGLWDPYLELIG